MVQSTIAGRNGLSWALAALLAPSAMAVDAVGTPLKQLMPWYHTSDELHSQLEELATRCSAAQLELGSRDRQAATGDRVTLDVVRLRTRQAGAGASSPQLKAMFVFGEHARELISAESAMHFLHTVCGQGPFASEARSLLDAGAELLIVPNANPVARRQVEAGAYCKRTNERGVDLNRNWGSEHRDVSEGPGDEQYAGTSSFSEPETEMLLQLIEDERPDLYLSVHSGAYLLGAPFGYAKSPRPAGASEAEDILRPISEQFCGGECPYGGLADIIGYKSSGCDIDYVTEHLGTRFAFTWEIYVGEAYRSVYTEKAEAMRGLRPESGDMDWSLVQEDRQRRLRRSGRVRTTAAIPEDAESIEGCLNQFSPRTKEATEQVLDRWSGAYLALCAEVASRHHGGGTAADVASPRALAF